MENETMQQTTGETAAAAVPQTGEEAQAPAAGVETENPDAEFLQLIKGKYKAAYDARVQDTLSRRLKHAREIEEKYNALLQLTQQPEPEPDAARVAALCDSWAQQEAGTRGLYPDFDLRTALCSEQFQRLLRSGVDIRTAYEVCNREKVLSAAMTFAARATEEHLAKRIAARSSRPAENAMGSRAAALAGNDVSRLTKRDIEEVSRRVARGERVSFG